MLRDILGLGRLILFMEKVINVFYIHFKLNLLRINILRWNR